MHLAPIIQDLAIILGVAGIVTVLFKKIKQPVVLGYLVAGILIGPFTLPKPLITDLPNIRVWAELGILFLLFSLGLEFTFHKLVRIGKTALITALIEISAMLSLSYFFGRKLGWPHTHCLFLAAALSISSTTLIIKTFETLHLKSKRFSEIVFGILIVEDLVAVLLLVFLSTFIKQQDFSGLDFAISTVKLTGTIGSWFVLGYFFIPSFFKFAGKWADNETLTVLASGLCLLLAVLASHLNYSAALGAFIMGSILGETNQSLRIEKLIQPLRDLFASVFFVSTGMLINPASMVSNYKVILTLSFLIIVGKTIASTWGAILTGQSLKRSFQIGVSLAQIGEFSFLIAALGTTLGMGSQTMLSEVVGASVITIFLVPYLMRISEPMATLMENTLPLPLKTSLTRYNQWISRPKNQTEFKKSFVKNILRFSLNAIIVTLLFFAVDYFLATKLSLLITWLIAILITAPFIWGMFFSFKTQKPFILFFLGQLITVVWISLLSLQFFSTFITFFFMTIGALVIFFLFYKHLEQSYRWFENQLVSNVSAAEKEQNPHLRTLAPWDVHLVKVIVHANSSLIGKSLMEAKIRETYGVNILFIQRGEHMLSPIATDILFPYDELLVLASDEQVENFKNVAEYANEKKIQPKSFSHYTLKQLIVSNESFLCGQTILNSGIRELYKGRVVGLERADLRTLNPDPNLVLREGDILWVVSEKM